MSGGIAYIYDTDGTFKDKCNMDMAELESMAEEDLGTVKELLINHHKYTQSTIAKKILENFTGEKKKFIKVMPMEYKRILEGKELEKKLELTEVSDG